MTITPEWVQAAQTLLFWATLLFVALAIFELVRPNPRVRP
jgi:hypothetical protein